MLITRHRGAMAIAKRKYSNEFLILFFVEFEPKACDGFGGG